MSLWYQVDLKNKAPSQDQQCDIERRLQAMEGKLTDLTNSINKISCPTTSSPQATATTDNSKTPNILALKALDEYRECEQNMFNLIFHNVPESSHSNPSSRCEQDLQTLANELGISHLEITNTIHLGQPRESGACLLKVTVSNLQSKRQLLFKAQNLHQVKSA